MACGRRKRLQLRGDRLSFDEHPSRTGGCGGNRYAEERGSSVVASNYLAFLFTKEGQEIAARHYLRPRDAEVAVRGTVFREIELFSVEELFGSWKAVEQKHFADDGIFDSIYKFERLKRHGY